MAQVVPKVYLKGLRDGAHGQSWDCVGMQVWNLILTTNSLITFIELFP